ncbi:MAG TPA: MFS transporter [Planctomycetaceae bacterium]|nr:MFS transporter [Planctomycetaceae bacterium]
MADNAFTPALAARTDPVLKARFSLMMFLQYFVQGSYLPVVTLFVQQKLAFSSVEMGWFNAALAVGPLLAPFIVGQMVDRHFATERVLAWSHLLGGGLMLAMYALAQVWESALFWPLVGLAALYSALYVPSMMLTNAMAFHHLRDREAEFPLIRLWGTIGFIVPAWLVEMVFLRGLEGDALNDRRGVILLVAGVAGLVMAAYCHSLPHTPPARNRQDIAPGRVLGLLGRRDFLVLVLVSLLVALAHAYFFLWNSPFLRAALDRAEIPGAWEQRISSIGQIFEIAVMAGLGFAIKRFGFKITMTVGATAYLLRALIFSWVIAADLPSGAMLGFIYVGQALHGLCFGCFLAAAYMYVDRVAPPDARGSMQTFYGTFIVGAGMFLGGFVGGAIGNAFTTDPGQPTVRERLGVDANAGLVQFTQTREGRAEDKIRDWPGIWLSSAAISAVALAAFALCFPKPRTDQDIGEPVTGNDAAGG